MDTTLTQLLETIMSQSQTIQRQGVELQRLQAEVNRLKEKHPEPDLTRTQRIQQRLRAFLRRRTEEEA